MNPDQLDSSTLDPKSRTMLQLRVEDLQALELFMNTILGKTNGTDETKKLIVSHQPEFDLAGRGNIQMQVLKFIAKAYKEYALAVIEDRAIPKYTDGLKPVQRRILYGAIDVAPYGSKFVKSARVVGEVLGKYHPHGDASVYNAMVRMSQDFKNNVPLIFPQGNWGDINNDKSYAAMRYTECMLSKMFDKIISNKEMKNTIIDYIDNFDSSLKEPTDLPVKLPLHIINGVSGVAVGYATDVMPHNVTEITRALIRIVESNYTLTTKELLEVVKGPDFPTGGIVNGTDNLENIYNTKGGLQLRAKVDVSVNKKGRTLIRITEVPYNVGVSELIFNIAMLAKNDNLPITDIDDYSDMNNPVDINIILKKDASADFVLNTLYKRTMLETNVKSSMILLDDNKSPKLYSLMELLVEFIKFRSLVIHKRSKAELESNQNRLHILEGIMVVYDNTDKVVSIIRKAKDKVEAEARLIKEFNLTEIQTKYILRMPLSSLCSLEMGQIKDEINTLNKRNKVLVPLTVSVKNKDIDLVMISEWLELLNDKAFIVPRKTKLVRKKERIEDADIVMPEDITIIITANGYIKRVSRKLDSQARGGKGKFLTEIGTEDEVKQVINCNAVDTIAFSTNHGKVYTLIAGHISDVSRGKLIKNIIELKKGEEVLQAFTFNKEDAFDLYLTTKYGLMKRLNGDEVKAVNKNGKRILTLLDNDTLVSTLVVIKKGEPADTLISSNFGKTIRIKSDNFRYSGTSAIGVNCIKLEKGDYVVSALSIEKDCELLFINSQGYIKKCTEAEFKPQSRGGAGVTTIPRSKEYGNLIDTYKIEEGEDRISIITKSGKSISLNISDIKQASRTSKGVKGINLLKDDEIVSIF